VRRFLLDPVVLVCGAVVLVALLIALFWSAAAPDSPAEVAEDRGVASAPVADGGTDGAGALDLQEVEDLSDVVGSTVVADATDVQGVPGDEGFWVDTGGESAWVQLSTAGESPFEVRGGQRVSFTGEVVAHGPDFAQRPEFSENDAEALVEAGAHIEVDVGDLRIVD
jgi:hypothetical protein